MNLPAELEASPIALAELSRGESGVVSALDAIGFGENAKERDAVLARLRDLGFVPGARCEVIARMWFGGDPIAVRVGGSTFALRHNEASAVRVMRVALAPGVRAATA